MQNVVPEVVAYRGKAAEVERLLQLHLEVAATSRVGNFLIYNDVAYGAYLALLLTKSDHLFTHFASSGRVDGFCHLRKMPTDSLFLNNIYLWPDSRTNGRGSVLLSESLQRFASDLSVPLELDVFESNTRAHAWYNRLGFRAVSRTLWTSLGEPLRDFCSEALRTEVDENGFTQLYVQDKRVGTKVRRRALLSDFAGWEYLGKKEIDEVVLRGGPVQRPATVLETSIRMRAPVRDVVSALEDGRRKRVGE